MADVQTEPAAASPAAAAARQALERHRAQSSPAEGTAQPAPASTAAPASSPASSSSSSSETGGKGKGKKSGWQNRGTLTAAEFRKSKEELAADARGAAQREKEAREELAREKEARERLERAASEMQSGAGREMAMKATKGVLKLAFMGIGMYRKNLEVWQLSELEADGLADAAVDAFPSELAYVLPYAGKALCLGLIAQTVSEKLEAEKLAGAEPAPSSPASSSSSSSGASNGASSSPAGPLVPVRVRGPIGAR